MQNENQNQKIDDPEDEFKVVGSEGVELSSGDTVQVIKELPVKGTKIIIRKGTIIKNIKLTGDEDLVECRYENMKGIMLRTEFLRKKSE